MNQEYEQPVLPGMEDGVLFADGGQVDPPLEERVARLEDLVGRLYETACAEQKKLIAEAMRV